MTFSLPPQWRSWARRCMLGIGVALMPSSALWAQDAGVPAASSIPVTRAGAIESALSHGARLGIARADTLTAAAQLITARALPDPTLATSYSKSTPQYHVSLDVPVDFPWLRRTRVRSAQATRQAAQYRYAFERAATALDADTTYTRALVARERWALSRRNAQDADSLRRMAIARREAGDASELDVELATVNAGQQANVAVADSLGFISALLDLQTVMGLPTNRIVVTLADSLIAPPPTPTPSDHSAETAFTAASGTPLSVAAAEAALTAAQLTAQLERRSVFTLPSFTVGFETRDPGGTGNQLLPTIGVSLPLPLWNRNRGAIAQAIAERERARAELVVAQRESQAEIARAMRERTTTMVTVTRDQALLAAANRVAAMSLVAYHEGAVSLPNVLEAQRNARDMLVQYTNDLASAWIATAVLRALTYTSAPSLTSPLP